MYNMCFFRTAVVALLQTTCIYSIYATATAPYDALITAAPILRLREEGLNASSSSSSSAITCGFKDGNPEQPWPAQSGSNCAYDNKNSLWGFCPIDQPASNCNLVGACFDAGVCSKGCGLTEQSAGRTVSCTESSSVCWSAMMTATGRAYTYIGCEAASRTPDNYFARPTTADGRSPEAVTAPESDDKDDPDSKKLNIGAIAGGVAGGIAVIIVLVLGLVYLGKRKRGGWGGPTVRTKRNPKNPVIKSEIVVLRDKEPSIGSVSELSGDTGFTEIAELPGEERVTVAEMA